MQTNCATPQVRQDVAGDHADDGMRVACIDAVMRTLRPGPSRLSRCRAALLAALLCAGAPAAAKANPVEIVDGICAQEIARAEAHRGIPAGLLSSIALAESGRWRDAHTATIAWPWTVMAEGKGRFFQSRAKAEAALRELADRSVTNVDVGCMQVNMRYHGDAFASSGAALDPARNVAYAADFLLRLKRRHGTWVQAVGHYHSANRTYNRPYMLRVFTYWVDVRKALAAASPHGDDGKTAAAKSRPEPRTAAAGQVHTTAERRTRFAEWVARRISRDAPGS